MSKTRNYVMRFLSGMAVLLTVAAMVPAGKVRAEDAAPAAAAGPAASGGSITVLSQNGAVPVFQAGETKDWKFTVINNSATEVDNVIVRPDLGDTTAVWPFETEKQDYKYEVGTMAGNQQKDISFTFTQREDVPTARYTISFAVSADGMDEQIEKFYVNTTAKPQEEKAVLVEAGGVANGDAFYSGGGSVGEGSGSSSIPRVIVTGFSTDPSEVRAGQDFTLTVHLKNTSKTSKVQNMLFDLSTPTEGTDEQTAAPAFLPSSGSSSVYLEGIGADKAADISIQLNAKSDLLQKPYSIDLAMKYEDGNNAQIESSSSLSIPVKQEARFELSEFEISPESVEVGDEANVMCNLYNLGRIKLYNVKAVFEGACIEKEEAFIGNVESGASASIDVMVKGKKATKGPAKVTMTLSYEDEAGKVTQKQSELKLAVEEAADEEAAAPEQVEESGGFPVVLVLIAAVILAVCIAAVVIVKKMKKRKMENEEEALLDEVDRSCEDELR